MKSIVQEKKEILLFYDGFEQKALDMPFGTLVSDLRGAARYLYRTLRRRQPYTGYYTAFRNLLASLRHQGYQVHVNRFDLARRDPSYPIGLCGYKSIFSRVVLDNPAIIFHAEFGLPGEVRSLTQNLNARIYSLGCQWACDLYHAELGDAIRPMFVAIDTNAWPDLSDASKDTDFIVYDKIRWNRAERVPQVLDKVQAEVSSRGLSSIYLRYGHHHIDQFRSALRRARGMIFLCEHETQGLAYQEAMASGLPILAWDEGELIDPVRRAFLPAHSQVSAVPYFDERCGLRFKVGGIPAAIDAFHAALPGYRPRDYVIETLGLDRGAEAFLTLYGQLAE